MLLQTLTWIERLAPLLYAGLGMGIVWGLGQWWGARQALRLAQFSLEREQAQQSGGAALTRILLCGQGLLLVYLLSTTTLDTLQNMQSPSAQAALDPQIPFRTAVPADSGESFVVPTAVADGVVILSTQPPSPTPPGTLLPASDPIGCLADQAYIDVPVNGQVIFEVTAILGIATIADFGYYRFEIRDLAAGTDFAVIGGAQSDYTTPITARGGPLGSIIPQNFLPGEYRFRLVVFDRTGLPRATCEISIFISDPPPTPTPIGAGPQASPIPIASPTP